VSDAWGFFGGGLDHDPEARRLVRERVGYLRDSGWKLRTGWDRKAPCGVVECGGGSYYIEGADPLLDHLYRLASPEGEKVYVSEPYWLHEEELREIGRSLDDWNVLVSSTKALWYPGHTVAVHFTRAEP